MTLKVVLNFERFKNLLLMVISSSCAWFGHFDVIHPTAVGLRDWHRLLRRQFDVHLSVVGLRSLDNIITQLLLLALPQPA
jgi:hypothetical protein